jgi:hypothetical protein
MQHGLGRLQHLGLQLLGALDCLAVYRLEPPVDRVQQLDHAPLALLTLAIQQLPHHARRVLAPL